MKPLSPEPVSPLDCLLGRELLQFRVYGSLLVLDFSPWRVAVTRAGRVSSVGEVGLHAQGAWRLLGSEGLVTGVLDAHRDPPIASEGGRTLADQRLAAFFREHRTLTVRGVSEDALGGAVVTFDSGYRLELVPMGTEPDDEFWRLLLPDGSQFVVDATGRELRTACSALPGG